MIPPDVRARLRSLRLLTRRAPAAAGFGQHAGRHRGAGLEFSQYRAYEPGDEPRRIDWKLHARSDRVFVREAERDSPLELWILVDVTRSMGQADRVRPAFSKLDLARLQCACLAELALQQADGFAVASIGDEAVQRVPSGRGVRHRDRLLREIAALQATGAGIAAAALPALWERIAPSSLVVAIGDGFDDAWVSGLERLAAARRDVCSVQLVAADERDFVFDGGFRFRDPESGEERLVDGGSARAEFREAFAAARAALARRLAAAGVRHVEQALDEPADAALGRLFAGRR